VLILANARQHIRLGLLKFIDKEFEALLDDYVPGPKGNKGEITIAEPGKASVPEFQGVIILLGIIAALAIAQIIHIFLAIWVYSAAKSVILKFKKLYSLKTQVANKPNN